MAFHLAFAPPAAGVRAVVTSTPLSHANQARTAYRLPRLSQCTTPLLQRRTTITQLQPFRAKPAHRRAVTVCQAAAAEDGKQESWVQAQQSKLKSLITPFSDPASNAKLLALCTSQMLCSVATFMHDTYLPVYLSDTLGLTNSKIGNLQAIAQFLCNFSKSFSGTLADILSPAAMVIFGTLLTTVNKPMFAASGWVFATFGSSAALYWITFGKVFDRMSKGVREAPAKALIGDLAQESGDRADAAFSLRQSLGTFGALIGASTAALAYQLSGHNCVVTFSMASVPALMAFILVSTAFGGRAKAAEKAAADAKAAKEASGEPEEVQLSLVGKAKAFLGALQPAYWQALAVVAVLYFARFDAGFVTLRAKQIIAKTQLPLLTSIMMITQAFLSTPFGLRAKASVKARNNTLLQGFFVLTLANAAFAFLPSLGGMCLGALCVGVHMAMTHGVLLAMMSTYIPSTKIPGLGKVSGTTWSFTDFMFGVILAYSNSLAGRLSDFTVSQGYGNIGCFFGGASASVLAALVLLFFVKFGDLGREDLVQKKPKPAAA